MNLSLSQLVTSDGSDTKETLLLPCLSMDYAYIITLLFKHSPWR